MCGKEHGFFRVMRVLSDTGDAVNAALLYPFRKGVQYAAPRITTWAMSNKVRPPDLNRLERFVARGEDICKFPVRLVIRTAWRFREFREYHGTPEAKAFRREARKFWKLFVLRKK
jgi:hypothetical protein